MEIKKKTWPEHFQLVLDGKKSFDLRLADFPLNKGDTLILEEYDPKTKEYTGRTLTKKVKSIIKFNPTDAHTCDEIKEHGFYEIEME